MTDEEIGILGQKILEWDESGGVSLFELRKILGLSWWGFLKFSFFVYPRYVHRLIKSDSL